MATTSYGVNNALAVKLWSNQLFREALKATWFNKFIGDTPDSLCQIKKDTQKGPGDKITIGLRMQLAGDGVSGDGTLEGNEEALVTYSDAIYIDQLRHATRSAGKMSEQRVPFDVREENYSGLRDWWANRLDTSFFNQLGGYTAQTDIRYTGMQATIAPDSAHKIYLNGSDDQSATSTYIFNLNVIDKAIEKAKTSTPVIRPLRINGEDKYVIFIHPYQEYDLRTSTTTGQWLDIQKAAMTGGQVSNSPIYTGAVGEYNNCIIHTAYRVPQGINSSTGAAISTVRRSIFCGAQSLCMAYGQNNGENKMTWVEQLFDYGNQLGVSAGMIFGIKKTVFNSADFSTLVIPTYAAAHG